MARAEGDARIIVEQAVDEAAAIRASISEEARAQALFEAQRIRKLAELDADRIRTEAAEAAGRLSDAGPVTALHSAEISVHQFPRAMRGYDRGAVERWLGLVELSHAILEQELDRARAEWGRALEALAGDGRAGNGARAELVRSREEMERTLETVPSGTVGVAATFQAVAVRSQLLEATLGRRLLGYARADVHRIFEAAAAHIARLEAQVDLLRAENGRIRGKILDAAAHGGSSAT